MLDVDFATEELAGGTGGRGPDGGGGPVGGGGPDGGGGTVHFGGGGGPRDLLFCRMKTFLIIPGSFAF